MDLKKKPGGKKLFHFYLLEASGSEVRSDCFMSQLYE